MGAATWCSGWNGVVTIEVAVIGIDGSGKSSNIVQSSEGIGKEHSVVWMSWKSVTYIKRERFYNLSSPKAGEFVRYTDLKSSLSNRIRTIWYRLRKASLLARLRPVFCFEDRDLVLDPLILSVSYVPVLRKVPIAVRVGFMKRVTFSHLSDVYIYLDISPETAYKRVCLRHRQEHKKLSVHENLQDLQLLRSQYEAGVAFLKNAHIPVCRVNTENCGIDESSQKIVDFLRQYLANKES